MTGASSDSRLNSDGEAARLEVVEQYRKLRIEQDQGLSELVGLAAQVCDAPMALITLVGEERQWFKASFGTFMEETAREASFCVHTLTCNRLLIVPDTRQDPRFAENPLVVGEPHIVFYAGMPLIDSNGVHLGALCVVDYKSRDLTTTQREALRSLGQYAMTQLEIRYELGRLERRLTASEAGDGDGSGSRDNNEKRADSPTRHLSEALEREASTRLEVERKLRNERDFSDQLINSLPGIFYLLDKHGRMVRWNRAAELATGRSGNELCGRPATDFFAPEEQMRIKASLFEGLDEGYTYVEAELRHRDGSSCPYYFGSRRVQHDGKDYIAGLGIDISARRAIEDRLRLWERAIEASVDAIVITEHGGGDNVIVDVNPAFERITGYTREEVLGRDPRFLQGTNDKQVELEHIRHALRDLSEGVAVIRNYRKDGKPFWNSMKVAPVRDAHGTVTHFVGIISDITASRYYQEQLEYRSNHDVLTGLANRNLLRDRLWQAIAYAQRYGGSVTTVLIDLDHFKLINESLGHQVGDQLLLDLSKRLKALLGEGDTLARPGGDEFMLVRYEPSEKVNISLLRDMLTEVSKPIQLADRELILTCSLGVSVYPQDGEDPDTLLRNADAAMYQAKEAGRNNIRVFKSEMNAQVTERLNLQTRLRRAVDQGDFELVYQPQIDLLTGSVVGLEALLRWRLETGEWVPPDAFIPIAEETGLIVPIGEWVLINACQQNYHWQRAGFPAVPVGVNLSARQFSDPELLDRVRRVLSQTGLDGSMLEVELTESAFMHNVEEGINTLNALKELGARLAVDDFGTGYSNLSYLKRFPVDLLKIDQSFVRDITTDPGDAAITQAVISLGHSLNLKVIAEGVETLEQHEFLRKHACDQLQGYYFSPPLLARDVPAVIRQQGWA
ncbi:hypothetical protein CAI21_03365 [Alkalilimnicola ehrlichii]|uniref:cyclic-guanylate-specific phosphodiesterase n=1 Tax=Alkalilimnicola ehrlichii TaxID=351052 RepID=A0A3E0X3S8_9GAMM|nr:EAL domain-containing protein [Alkalilimnicola ehrlichii]RFA31024.1 hypothetical protein CAI21_03365 [Alkalilimnicola ehrlichii]RFA38977.1 hypothetical protein CAL65_03515 [Alkalilimnicola ehrlichii]